MKTVDAESEVEGNGAADQSAWFCREIHPHDLRLKSYLRGAFPALRDVDDVVQESYLKVWRARMRRPIRSAKSFLYQVARHIAVDWVRRRRIVAEEALTDWALEAIVEDGICVAERACRSEEIAFLAQALHALPERCREVMILRQIQGFSQKEISIRLNISELTVQTHVVHGLRRLEKSLRRRFSDRIRP